MAKLLLKHEGVTLKTYKLDNQTMNIGRKFDNEIQLDDSAVSSHHARLSFKPNEYLDDFNDVYIEDLGSTNGTIVNSKQVLKQILKHGDIIVIGSHEFTFDSEQEQDLENTAIILPDSE